MGHCPAESTRTLMGDAGLGCYDHTPEILGYFSTVMSLRTSSSYHPRPPSGFPLLNSLATEPHFRWEKGKDLFSKPWSKWENGTGRESRLCKITYVKRREKKKARSRLPSFVFLQFPGYYIFGLMLKNRGYSQAM